MLPAASVADARIAGSELDAVFCLPPEVTVLAADPL
jgi:hypothetical protein